MQGYNGKEWVNLNSSTTEKETEEMGKSHEETRLCTWKILTKKMHKKKLC